MRLRCGVTLCVSRYRSKILDPVLACKANSNSCSLRPAQHFRQGFQVIDSCILQSCKLLIDIWLRKTLGVTGRGNLNYLSA